MNPLSYSYVLIYISVFFLDELLWHEISHDFHNPTKNETSPCIYHHHHHHHHHVVPLA